MENKLSSAEDLKTIRKIMEESTRFLSLSGLSGVFLGLFAIAGALIVRFFVLNNGNISLYDYFSNLPGQETEIINLKMITIAVSVLLLSLITATGFSVRKARRSGVSLWTPVSKRLYASVPSPGDRWIICTNTSLPEPHSADHPGVSHFLRTRTHQRR